MMNITKSREEFEKWANRLPSISITGRLERCGENYVDDYHTVFWLAWQASRESIEVVIPPFDGYKDHVAKELQEALKIALRTAGIRIKGESE
ncbi:hypothetical protein [Yersinia massiliensis]|uniref:hypothetical protein n=1 Tax=Yersinia massiliensis TaxID=419257 RepID=UPI000C14B329|nr:hypothetical protein [Yersinia massiliensis]PHZ22207.1 hypothetical protein CS535_18055 [Yersinia massiliensis]